MARRKSKKRYGRVVSPAKARKILRDGSVRGHKLTPKQRRFFGAQISKGRKRR